MTQELAEIEYQRYWRRLQQLGLDRKSTRLNSSH